MNFQEALCEVREVQTANAFPGLLETLEFMRDNREELNHQELRAYRVVFHEMAKLFAPAR